MKPRSSVLRQVFPADLNHYRGSRWVVVAMASAAALLTARSVIYMFASDGGAESIATIDVDIAGGETIVAIFAQWGALQLLLASIVWVVFTRLRTLIPFMALVLFLEPVLRAAMGSLKPLETVGTAPGAALNNVVLIPLGALLVLSVTTIRGQEPAATPPDDPT